MEIVNLIIEGNLYMNKFAIEKITIQGIGGITNLELPFKNGLNLICGTNGIGKTTILECISHAFIRNTTYKLKKNVNVQKGTCESMKVFL